jgi:hypothetical protein
MFRRFAAHGSWVKSAEKTPMYNSGLNFATKRGPVNTLRNTSTACWAGAIKRRETDVEAVWMKSGKPTSQTPHGPIYNAKLSEPNRTRLTCLLGCNVADLRAGPLRRGEVGHGDHHAFVDSLSAEEP